jgi:hypothetical protein
MSPRKPPRPAAAPSTPSSEPLRLPEFDPDDYDPTWDNYLHQIRDQDLIQDRYLLDDEEGEEAAECQHRKSDQ